VERLMAAIVETHGDDAGLKLPSAVAPFDIMILELGDTAGTTERIHDELSAQGLEVLLDNRQDVRAGEKFAEFELIGIPTAVVVGKRSLETGMVEIRNRLTGERLEVKLEDVVRVLI
jgi:prolyl-tRNA synthetase